MTLPPEQAKPSQSAGVDFDPNTPPPMPLSALLYSPHWMKQVRWHAPWLVYPMMRNARRDAMLCAHWLHFYAALYCMSIRWLETNVEPVRIYR